MNVRIDHISKGDRDWIERTLRERWGDVLIVSRGRLHHADLLPGFVARSENSSPVGLLTYRIDGNECEIITLDAFTEGMGIGTALVNALLKEARSSGWSAIRLTTTNDNRRAQSFWGRRGFRLTAIRAGAMEEARRLKPSIPEIGHAGIPVLDELEYEYAG